MKIAVTYENGNVFQHFGHTEQFKVYDVENGEVVSSRVTDTNGQGHGALAGAFGWREGGRTDLRRHWRRCTGGSGRSGDPLVWRRDRECGRGSKGVPCRKLLMIGRK